MTQAGVANRVPVPSPMQARRLLDRLEANRHAIQKTREDRDHKRRDLVEYLAVADDIKQALEAFSEQLFSELVEALQSQLTRALQDVLDQPIEFKVDRGSRLGAVTLGFYVERAGQREDIMKGQGGSVVNILSVGLRLLALHGQDEKRHRRFLVLDEQDCWLRPDLVPKLVRIIHDAGQQMGFQILMISHHDPAMFEKYADRIYRCCPHNDGAETSVVIERVQPVRRDAD